MQRELTVKESQLLEKFSSKLALQPVDATFLSVIKDNSNFIMHQPVIYKIADTDSYLIFGDFVSGYDLDKLKEHMQQYDEKSENNDTIEAPHDHSQCSKSATCTNSESLVGEPEDGQLREEDVVMLVDQFGIAREEAVQALADNNYDSVEAMMQLHKKK